jgi:hypothetical protein
MEIYNIYNNCIFSAARVAGDPRKYYCANRVFVAITLYVRARAFNLGKVSNDPAYGRFLAWEAPSLTVIPLAHWAYLGSTLMAQTTVQHIYVSNTQVCDKIGKTCM